MSTPLALGTALEAVKLLRREGASSTELEAALERAAHLAIGCARAELIEALQRLRDREPSALNMVDAAVASGDRQAWTALLRG